MRRLLLVLLLLGLTASLAVTWRLYGRALFYYAEQMKVRLDPAGEPFDTQRADVPAVSVIYFGDSRIAMWPKPPAPEGEALNRGIGGQTTAQLLLRLDRDVLAHKPRVVVIQCGVNDLKAIGVLPERHDEIVRRCVENLRTMVDRLRAADVRVVVTTVWPCGQPDLSHRPGWSDATHESRHAVNAQLLCWQLAGVEVVHCDDLLADAGLCKPECCIDHLHLSPAGYAAIAPRIEAAVRRATRND